MSPFNLIPRLLIALKAMVRPQVAILLSQAPLPQIHPSAISAENGGWVQVSGSPAGTVSMWLYIITLGVPVVPRYLATMLTLLSSGSTISTSSPSVAHSAATRAPIADSSPVTLLVCRSLRMKEITSSLWESM